MKKEAPGIFLDQCGDDLRACTYIQHPLVVQLLNVTRTFTNQNKKP